MINGFQSTSGAAMALQNLQYKNVVDAGKRQRQTMNVVGVHTSIYLPWVLFCVVSSMLTFEWRYHAELLCYALAFVALAVVGIFGLIGYAMSQSRRSAYASESRWEPSWFVFIFVTGLVAWLLAVSTANFNYWRNMQPYHDVQNLNMYSSIDPARMRGQQLMDAGQVQFVPGAHVDTRKMESFKNLDTYCVAPIVVGDLPFAAYDFWAVGVNCCDEATGRFECGPVSNGPNPTALGGIRLMRDDQRPFFRLAVQQAESTHNIRAIHPLFFHWEKDTAAAADLFRVQGYRYYLLWMFAHFALQLTLVFVASYFYLGKTI